MELETAAFYFSKGHVHWHLNGENAPICDWEHSKSKGKTFKWSVRAVYKDWEMKFNCFGTPSLVRSRRMLQNIKKQISQSSN